MKTKCMKGLLASLVSLAMVASLAIGVNGASARTYTITFAPGLMGTFKESWINKVKKDYDGVKVSKATGAVMIPVTVSSLENAALKDIPTASDIATQDATYVVGTSWTPASHAVTGNATYVVQYNRAVNTVEYTIKYVDATTNQDVSSPIIARGNEGETITGTAAIVDQYSYDVESKTMKLTSKASENVMTFYYTSTATPSSTVTNVLPGGTTTTYNYVTTTTGNTAGGTTNGTGGTTTDNTANVEDNNTPTTNGNTSDSKQSTDTVEDNKTATTSGDSLTKNNQTLYMTLGGLGALVLLIFAILFAKRRKEKKA